MSLPNPNSVVTEQRLSEFYTGIRPYLGGMPDILANKFNKSDLYSESEQLIGRWIDGKPLYQKTVDCGALPNNSTKVVDLNLSKSSVEVVSVNAVSKSGNQYIPMPYISTSSSWNVYFEINDNSGSNNLYAQIVTSANWSSATCYVTVQYTKTNDAAIAIGSDTDYSTTEKIVGTWIDGKPIYQKTVDCGAIPNNTTKTINPQISNIDKVISCFGEMMSDEISSSYPLPYVTTDKTWDVLLDFTEGNIRIITSTDLSMLFAYVTLRYTKTTD